VGESSFWYRPTRVVPDQRPLNGRCCIVVYWYSCVRKNKINIKSNKPSRVWWIKNEALHSVPKRTPSPVNLCSKIRDKQVNNVWPINVSSAVMLCRTKTELETEYEYSVI